MKLFKLIYFISKALESIRRNPFINLITIGVIAISFLIFSTFLMLFGNLNSIFALWEEDIQIEAYLKDGADMGTVDEARRAILAMTEVEDATYVSKDEALERFKERMEGMASIADNLGENPLPPSFEVTMAEKYRDFQSVDKTAKKIKTISGIDDVIYGQEWAERFSTSLAIVRLIGLIVGAFLLMATIFIISNTIKLTVYTKKEELEISRLLGATNSFIKFPFYIEGLLQGFVGSGLSILILFIIYKVFVLKMASSMEMALTMGAFQITFLSTPTMIYILIGGMALGLFGSFVSLGRFLKI